MEYTNYNIQNPDFDKHEVFSRGGSASSAAWSHHLNKMAPIFPDMMTIMGGHAKQDDYNHGGHGQDSKSNVPPPPVSMYEAKPQQQQPPPAHPQASPFPGTLEPKQEVVDVTPDIDGHNGPGGVILGSRSTNEAPRRGKSNECEICHKVSTTRQNLKIHMRVHTGEKPYQCDFCQKRFTQACSLKIHTRIHTGENRDKTQQAPKERKYQCNYCLKRFTQSGSLKIHTRIHTGERPFKCDYCEKGFTSSQNQKTHMRSHMAEKSSPGGPGYPGFPPSNFQARNRAPPNSGKYVCDYCQKRFTQQGSLKIHQRIHTGEKPYNCDFCEKAFISRQNLNTHRRVHTGEKPPKQTHYPNYPYHSRPVKVGKFQCEYCQKRFTQASSLATHTKIHTGEKPHKCDFCEKGFITSQNLKTHRRTHTGEKPYQCEVCQKCFSQICGLKTHRKTHERLQGNFMGRDGATPGPHPPSSLPPTPSHRLPTPSPQHQQQQQQQAHQPQLHHPPSPTEAHQQHRNLSQLNINNGIKTENTTVASLYENHRSTNLVPLALMKH